MSDQLYSIKRGEAVYHASSLSILRSWIRDGNVQASDLIQLPNETRWRPLDKCQEFVTVRYPEQFVVKHIDQYAPLPDMESVIVWAKKGKILPEDQIYVPVEGVQDWIRVSDSTELMSLLSIPSSKTGTDDGEVFKHSGHSQSNLNYDTVNEVGNTIGNDRVKLSEVEIAQIEQVANSKIEKEEALKKLETLKKLEILETLDRIEVDSGQPSEAFARVGERQNSTEKKSSMQNHRDVTLIEDHRLEVMTEEKSEGDRSSGVTSTLEYQSISESNQIDRADDGPEINSEGTLDKEPEDKDLEDKDSEEELDHSFIQDETQMSEVPLKTSYEGQKTLYYAQPPLVESELNEADHLDQLFSPLYDAARLFVITKALRPKEVIEGECFVQSLKRDLSGLDKRGAYTLLLECLQDHLKDQLRVYLPNDPQLHVQWAELCDCTDRLIEELASGVTVIGTEQPKRVIIGNVGRPKMTSDEEQVLLNLTRRFKELVPMISELKQCIQT